MNNQELDNTIEHLQETGEVWVVENIKELQEALQENGYRTEYDHSSEKLVLIPFDYHDGSEWIKVNASCLNGVANLRDVKEIYEEGDKLKVVYEDGSELYYSKIHGTWGNPVKFQ